MKIMSKIKTKWYQNQVDSLQATLEKEKKELHQAYHIQIQGLEKELQQKKEKLRRRYMKLRGALEVKLKKNEKLLPRLTEDWSIVTDQAVKYEIEIKTKQANDDIPKLKKQLALLKNALEESGYLNIEDEEINEDEEIKSIKDDIEITVSDLKKLKDALAGKGDDKDVENEKIKNLTDELNLLKSALATGDDSKIPEQCKPKPDEKNSTRKKQLQLLDNVKKGWIEGVLRQSLHNEVLIELKKTQNEAAVDRFQQQPLNLTREANEARPDQTVLLEDDIQEIYEEGERTLLILGAPGAGKTISLLELTHRLAEDAAFDASQPIPVVFNLSSWAEKHQPLQDWLTDELLNKYNIPRELGRGWVKDAQNQPLVLMLDGLDEVDADQRAACVQAINVYRQEYALGGIVVACRFEEYNALAEKLKLEQALCVQPLTEEQIKNYLAAGGEELAGLRTALESDAALQELASSPLMLSMMCLAYQHQTQEAVLQDVSGTAETRRTKLFAAYVQRMFQRPRSGAVYTTDEQTSRWLTFLAYNMQKHGQTIFQMENLQPSWLLTKGGIWLYIMLFWGLTGALIEATIIIPGFIMNNKINTFAYLIAIKVFITFLSISIYDGIMMNYKNNLFVIIINKLFLLYKKIINASLYFLIKIKIILSIKPPKMVKVLLYMLLYILMCISVILMHIYDMCSSILIVIIIVLFFFTVNLVCKYTINHFSFYKYVKNIKLYFYKYKNIILLNTMCRVVSIIIPLIISEIISYYIIIYTFGFFSFFIKKISIGINILIYILIFHILYSREFKKEKYTDIQFETNAYIMLMNIIYYIFTSGILILLIGSIDSILLLIIIYIIIITILTNFLAPRFGFAEKKKDVDSKLSWSYSQIILFLGISLCFTIIFVLITKSVIHASIIGVLLGAFFTVWFGALDFLKHFTLRFVLWLYGYAPWNYARFLDHATDRLFLRKVGGGYIFVHRLLLEYFAADETQLNLLFKKKTPQQQA